VARTLPPMRTNTLTTDWLIERDDAAWPAATAAFDLTLTQEPAVVAMPATDDDVVAIVDFARDHGLQVAPQRTGHNANPLGPLDDTVLLRTDRLQGVSLDLDRRVARVRAGARWEDVVPAASDAGLAALHGSTPDVSVPGYALGGGVGWYARKHGLCANSIAAIELVTADGRLRRVDRDHDPDLFWALRGGGGNFGVVTALEVELLPIREVYAGVLFFDWARASEVLGTWLQWCATAPDEVTSVGRILQLPPFEHLPEPLRGRKFAAVDAVVLGDERFGRDVIEPLRALRPEIDTFSMRPPAGIAELHMDPRRPVAGVTDSMMLGDLPAEAIDRFLDVAGPDSGSRLLVADVRQLGGALRRPQPHHGALSTLDASFLTMAVGHAADPDSHDRLLALGDALAPYDTGRRYSNFAERTTDSARFFAPDVHRRLRAVRAVVDPDGLFRANHPIGRS
jgi:FAD binding domain/Berberine and berberine like